MADVVDVNFNFGGEWKFDGQELEYINGDVDTIVYFDVDFLSYIDILGRYKEQLGFPHVSSIFVLEPGKKIEGWFIFSER